ncbi:DUF805 domain-containing protein [Vibrio barjaei]|uniref:DUF805 domain-containing protein n=1 Tax=Vibrio barjaei TaxID=1676683 RepID=UPI002284C8EA|nr:DUF805 domain-containing protein [Vibrio barjaei]MCY9874071.1 hypothetical protein [Vibrio barjaei]
MNTCNKEQFRTYTLKWIVVVIMITTTYFALPSSPHHEINVMTDFILYINLFTPLTLQIAKRLNDIGLPENLATAGMIPGVNLALVVVICFLDSNWSNKDE